MTAKATLADVARVAGVSRATATRAIHESGYVSDDNRQRVLKAVESTGYRPNLQARSLRMQRSYTLGLVLSSARTNPFFTNVSHAVRTAAMDRGYSMLTVNHVYSDQVEQAGVRQFLDNNVEAIILCHGWRAASYRPILAAGLPIIQIERRLIASAHLVAIDPLPGMIQAVDALVAAGHRRLAFLGASDVADPTTGEVATEPERARLQAFLSATRQAGLRERDCPVRLGSYSRTNDAEPQPGYRQTLDLFSSAGTRSTAIIAGSDIIAAGVLQALHKLGIRVPDEVSLVGYDDSLAQFLAPPLSSVSQPYSDVGRLTIDLVEALRDPNLGAPIEVRTTSSLVIRESVASAPRGSTSKSSA